MKKQLAEILCGLGALALIGAASLAVLSIPFPGYVGIGAWCIASVAVATLPTGALLYLAKSKGPTE